MAAAATGRASISANDTGGKAIAASCVAVAVATGTLSILFSEGMSTAAATGVVGPWIGGPWAPVWVADCVPLLVRLLIHTQIPTNKHKIDTMPPVPIAIALMLAAARPTFRYVGAKVVTVKLEYAI